MIAARLDSSRIDGLLRRIEQRGGDLSSPLSACGEILRTSIARNFEVGGRYSTAGSVRGGSNKWVRLAASTMRMRNPAYRIMEVSGELALSVTPQVSGNTLVMSTNKPQAALLHHGGKTKAHKITARHGKALAFVGKGGGMIMRKSINHPGSNVPARPFMVVQDEDVEEIMDVLAKHVVP
jgi:phage gpG-like protein